MKYIKIISIVLAFIFLPTVALAAIFQVIQGGTGASTLTGCLTGNGTAPFTGTGSACGAGGSGGIGGTGAGSSTNPFMATYFAATSTTATSTFAGGLKVDGFFYGGQTITTIYVDSNNTATYTANGSIFKPYTSISAAITGTPAGLPVLYNLAPGTYVEGPPVTFPNVQVTVAGGGSTIVFVSGATFQNAFLLRNSTISGNITLTDTSATNGHIIESTIISGNVIANAGITAISGGAFVNGTINIKAGAQLNVSNSFNQNIIYNDGLLYWNSNKIVVTNNSVAAINATSTIARVVMSSNEINNFGTGGGLNITAPATSSPHEVGFADINVGVGTLTTAALNCGSGAASIVSVNINDVAGKQYQPQCMTTSNFISNILNTTGSTTASYFIGTSTSIASSFASSIRVGNPVSNFTDLGQALGMFSTSTNNYAYVGMQNLAAGAMSSSDFVWGNELTGTSVFGYSDCGMSSNIYLNATYPFIDRNNFYCYNTVGPMSFVSATTTNRAAYINFLVGGYASTTNEIGRFTSIGLGIGTTSPFTRLGVAGTITANNINATSTTATSTLSGGFVAGNNAIVMNVSTGTTSISSLEMGPISFADNAGVISWIDELITSASPNNTPQGYTAFLNGSSTISVYGLSAGTGWLQADYPRVAIGSTTAPTSKLTVFSGGTGTNGTFELTNASNVSLLKVLDNGNISASSTAPTVSSGSVDGTNNGGYVAGCTSACTVTFANGGFTKIPECIVQPYTGSLVNVFSYTVSATTIVVTETGLGTFAYHCGIGI